MFEPIVALVGEKAPESCVRYRVAKLREFDDSRSCPDYKTLKNIVLDYRQFVGTEAAFHVEYLWWPGKFETKVEEMNFDLDESGIPENYEVVGRWHEEAVTRLAACNVELVDTRLSRNLWRIAAIVLLIPYLTIWYFWRSNV